jgi:hypothetical protein
MSFTSFDSAVLGFREFLARFDWPTSLRWLVMTRVRWNRRGLYVYQPDSLTDSTPHQRRFELAIEKNKNIAFIAYVKHKGSSLIGLETIGLDPPYADFDESGSHNYKTLESSLNVIPVNRPFVWRLAKMFVPNNYPGWNCLGWPN